MYRTFVFISILILTYASFPLEANRRRPSFEEDNSIMLREILDNLDFLKNEVQIHDSQIAAFEEKFKTADEIIDSVRQQMYSNLQAIKESIKNHSVDLNAKLADQQNSAKSLITEVKSSTTDYQQILNNLNSKIAEIEKSIEQQNSNITTLQAALNSIIDIIKKENQIEKSEVEKIYKVKSGDSLEKIAKQNQTSVKKLKELNNLTSDQIITGQKLKISE